MLQTGEKVRTAVSPNVHRASQSRPFGPSTIREGRTVTKDRKATPRLLDGLLREECLISSGVSGAKCGAVDDLNPSSTPEILGCGGLIGFANEMIVDVLKPLERQSGPSLAVGAVL